MATDISARKGEMMPQTTSGHASGLCTVHFLSSSTPTHCAEVPKDRFSFGSGFKLCWCSAVGFNRTSPSTWN